MSLFKNSTYFVYAQRYDQTELGDWLHSKMVYEGRSQDFVFGVHIFILCQPVFVTNAVLSWRLVYSYM